MAKLKLPFELEKPSSNEYVTQASEISYGGIPAACGLIYDISVAKAVNNVPAKYESLSTALGTNGANIPQDIRRGGMSIKFIQSSDNKYVQYRLMNQAWSTAVSDWQGVNSENLFEIIEPIGYYMTLPDSSVGIDGDYIMLSNATTNHRIYQKINGTWTNVTSRMNPHNYYLWRGLFYYKEDLTDNGKFLPINDSNINRVNLAGSLDDFNKSSVTLTKQEESINSSYLNTVYKVDVNADTAGNLSKAVSISASKGVSIGFLVKSLGNESDLDVVSVRYNSATSIYYIEKRQPLGNGWYFFNYYQWNVAISSIMLFFDMRGLSAGSFLVSGVQICEGLYPLQPNYLTADNNIQKQIDILKNNSWNIVPVLNIGSLPSASEGNNGDYTILKNSNIDFRLYKKVSGAWVNDMDNINTSWLFSLGGILYHFTSITGSSPKKGPLETYMADNINRINLVTDIESLTSTNLTLTRQSESINNGYVNTVYKVDVNAGLASSLKLTNLSLSTCTVALLCKVAQDSDISLVSIRRNDTFQTSIPTKYQNIGSGWYFICAQIKNSTTSISFLFDLRGVESAKTFYISDLQVCEGLLPLVPNFAVKSNNSSDVSIKHDWCSKILSTYGDSVTAHCNGDFTSPFDISGTNWASKVASYYDIAKAHNRGIGGQAFLWGNGGGALAWCSADGNYVNRKNGVTYDDYLNPSTHDSVLEQIESMTTNPYNPNIHTLVRGSLSSWLRIKTMFPISIKDTISVVLVMAHNDADFNTTKLNAELSWVSQGAIDVEWAASTQYQSYGGDYNIQDSLKGAIASTIMKLQAWMPQAAIVLMTPISGRGVTGELNPALTDANMQLVAEKVREVHKLMSIPLIDMYATDGINGLNRTTYISDSIHPFTVAGSKALARAVVGGLKIIEPRDLFD